MQGHTNVSTLQPRQCITSSSEFVYIRHSLHTECFGFQLRALHVPSCLMVLSGIPAGSRSEVLALVGAISSFGCLRAREDASCGLRRGMSRCVVLQELQLIRLLA